MRFQRLQDYRGGEAMLSEQDGIGLLLINAFEDHFADPGKTEFSSVVEINDGEDYLEVHVDKYGLPKADVVSFMEGIGCPEYKRPTS